jgi:hypothetical protein
VTQADEPHSVITFAQAAEDSLALISGPVVDIDELKTTSLTLKDLKELLMQLGQTPGLVVHGDHHAQAGSRLFIGCRHWISMSWIDHARYVAPDPIKARSKFPIVENRI